MTVWMHRAQGEADAMGARHGDGVEDVFVTRRDGVGEPAPRVAAVTWGCEVPCNIAAVDE